MKIIQQALLYAKQFCFLILLMCIIAVPTAHASISSEMLLKLTQLQQLLKNYQTLLQQAPQVLGESIIIVTNNTELLNALIAVSGGETIQLAPGNYGNIFIAGLPYSKIEVAGVWGGKSPVLTAPVKITSQDPTNRAVVSSIETRSANNWWFDSLIVKPSVPSSLADTAVMLSGDNNRIENCWVTYSYENSDSWNATKWSTSVGSGISAMAGSGIVIKNNYVSNIYMGIAASELAPNTQIISNVVNYFSGDGIRAMGDNSLIEGNLVKNIRVINDNHPDGFQSWSTGTDGTPGKGVVSGITVRGNTFLLSENLNHPLAIAMQGIGLFDGDYKDWVIEDNVIMTDAYHGIAVTGSINTIVRHNTVVNIRQIPTIRTWITIAAHKEATISSGLNIVNDNVSTLLSLAPGATVFNATSSVDIRTASTFPANNYIIPMANYADAFVDLSTFNVRLKSPSSYNNAGSRIFLDPLAITVPTIPNTLPPTPAPTINLTSSLSSVALGGSATLAWNSSNATACTASGAWSGSKSTSGSESTDALTTAGTKTYTLSCTGSGGSQTKTVTVTVTNPVVIGVPALTLSTSASSVTTGNTTTLTWSSANATACTASGNWTGNKSTNGSETLPVYTTTGTKTYILTCTGDGGTITKNVSIAVTDATVPTAAFKVGDKIAVTDNVNVRTSGLISPTTLIGVNPAGSQGVLTSGPTVSSDKYGTITWFNVNFDSGFDGWTGIDYYSLLTTVPPQTPALTFTSSPASVTKGSNAMLSWETSNVTTCTASGDWSGSKNNNGSVSTGALKTIGAKTYILTCTGSGGSVTKSVTVNVTAKTSTDPVPTLTLSSAPASVIVGGSSVLAWNSTNATACSASGDWSGSKSTNGSESTGALTIVGSTLYALTCTGTGGSASLSATVRVANESTIATTTAPIRVITNDTVNVRSTPNGAKIGIQPAGVQGTLGTQPSVSTGSHTWVYVNFDTGIDGYVAKKYLSVNSNSETQVEGLLRQLATLQQLLVDLEGQ